MVIIMEKFDIDNKHKCPNCGHEMDYIYGDMVCSNCQYRISYNDYKKTPVKQTLKTDKKVLFPKENVSPVTCIRIIAVLATLVVLVFSIKPILKYIDYIRETSTPKRGIFKLADESEEYDEESMKRILQLYTDMNSAHNDSDTEDQDLSNNSEGIVRTLELIFSKDISEITADEVNSITYLDFNTCNSDKIVNYIITSDDETQIHGYVYPGEVSFSESDFSIFTNLTTLQMDYGSISSLEGLDNFCVLGTTMPLEQIVMVINPEKLISLSLFDPDVTSDFSLIVEFKNLMFLNVSSKHLSNIEYLAELKKLDTLRIFDNEDLTDFQVLYELPQIKSLFLDCRQLDNIDFINKMPNLDDLSICNSNVTNIDILKARNFSLRSLTLENNGNLTNYNIISELNNLHYLELYVDESPDNTPIPIPDLENLTKLTSLTLEHFDDLSELKNVPTLQELILYDIHTDDFSSLTELKELDSLELNDMSIPSSALKYITKLDSLTYIYLDNSLIEGNVQDLLNLPNLNEFYMIDCHAGFDVSNPAPNPCIEIINLNNSRLHTLKNGKWDSNDDTNILALSENTDIFKNYENLKELCLSEQAINNIEFAASLTNLEILNIDNNDVTDLTPLKDLPQLKCVSCLNNPIDNDGGLGHIVVQ